MTNFKANKEKVKEKTQEHYHNKVGKKYSKAELATRNDRLHFVKDGQHWLLFHESIAVQCFWLFSSSVNSPTNLIADFVGCT